MAVQSDLLRPDEAAEQPSRSPSPSVSAVLQYAAVHAAALGVLVVRIIYIRGMINKRKQCENNVNVDPVEAGKKTSIN